MIKRKIKLRVNRIYKGVSYVGGMFKRTDRPIR